MEKNCLECNKKFSYYPSENRKERGYIRSYCSRQCYSKSRIGIKRPPRSSEWSMKISVANKGRIGCFTGHKHSIESRMKISNANIGNKKRWKGGLEMRKKYDQRNDSAYQCWVKDIKKRDNGCCQLQNERCFGYKIVHHILPWRDYPEERYNIQNGITLCQYHHPRKHMDEQKMIPILQNIINK